MKIGSDLSAFHMLDCEAEIIFWMSISASTWKTERSFTLDLVSSLLSFSFSFLSFIFLMTAVTSFKSISNCNEIISGGIPESKRLMIV